MPLTMDDETQYRCAGFVQAEIEQFVDDVDESPGEGNGSPTEEDSNRLGSASEENEDAGQKARKAKRAKTKKVVREGSPGMSMCLGHLVLSWLL